MSRQEMAERLARTYCGDKWDLMLDTMRVYEITVWLGILTTIEAAGLAMVEAEDGR